MEILLTIMYDFHLSSTLVSSSSFVAGNGRSFVRPRLESCSPGGTKWGSI